MQRIPVSILFFIFLILSLPTVQADRFDDALSAYQQKKYTRAIKLFQPLAEQGDVRAQYNLGLAYRKQQGAKSGLSRNYLIQSRSGGLIDSYLLMSPGHAEPLLHSADSWLFRQNAQSYTLQLATGKTPQYLNKMKQQLISGKKLEQSENLSILEVKVVSKQDKNTQTTRYVLVYGVFDSYQNAKAEVARLPDSLQKSSPWIRQLGVLQSIVSKDTVKK